MIKKLRPFIALGLIASVGALVVSNIPDAESQERFNQYSVLINGSTASQTPVQPSEQTPQKIEEGVAANFDPNNDPALVSGPGVVVPTANPTPVTTPVPTSLDPQTVLEYYKEVALGSEFGEANKLPRYWITPPRIFVEGGTEEMKQQLTQVVEELRQLTGLNIQFTASESDANLLVIFTPISNFEANLQRLGCGARLNGINRGYFWACLAQRETFNEISRGIVLIDSEDNKDALMNSQTRGHLIREEVTQIMGLMNDSPKYPDSIFSDHSNGAWSSATEFSAIDKKIIKMHYEKKPNL